VSGGTHWASRRIDSPSWPVCHGPRSNQLETGALVDLGVIKLACLLELVGLTFEAHARATPHRGLLMASRTASVSYKTQLDAGQLAKALATGEVPPGLLPHVATFLDEAQLPLVVSAVEEAAKRGRVPPKRIWQHVVRWASEIDSPRRVWS
jgi:hypothetical protein